MPGKGKDQIGWWAFPVALASRGNPITFDSDGGASIRFEIPETHIEFLSQLYKELHGTSVVMWLEMEPDKMLPLPNAADRGVG